MLCGAVIAGIVADQKTLGAQRFDRPARAAMRPMVGAGDFHVHAFPGDGLLPGWELQREAARRGLDVIAITNHNQTFAARLLRAISGDDDVMVLRGQEITSSRYHMIAAGIGTRIDWRLSAADAAAAVHEQGGVAIAAHPIDRFWLPRDPATLGALDGAEVAHPVMYFVPGARDELAAFYAAVRAVNPRAAPIGSSDVHSEPGMGECRTFLVVEERSEKGVLDAIRNGRTVASDRVGNFIGDPALVEIVQQRIPRGPHIRPPHRLHQVAALSVLLALACLVIFR